MKGVIIAAGFGSRFFPITKSIPKEMLPLGNKPIIHYAVEEMLQAGVKEILIVTSRRKKVLEDYFDADPELDLYFSGMKEKKYQPFPENTFSLYFVRQPYMRGTGDTILLVKDFVKDEPFLVSYPDELYYTPPKEISVWSHMIHCYEKFQHSILLCQEEEGDVSRYGVVKYQGHRESLQNIPVFQVDGLVEKPPAGQEPSHIISLGRYLLDSAIFPILESLAAERANHPDASQKEFYLTEGLEQLAQAGRLYGTFHRAHRIDTGTLESYIEACQWFYQHKGKMSCI